MQKCTKVAKSSEENIRKVCKMSFFLVFFLMFSEILPLQVVCKVDSFTQRTIVPYDVLLRALSRFLFPIVYDKRYDGEEMVFSWICVQDLISISLAILQTGLKGEYIKSQKYIISNGGQTNYDMIIQSIISCD